MNLRQTKRSKPHWLYSIPMVLMLAYIVFVGSKKTIENFRLREGGKRARAWIVDCKQVGGKGVVRCRYLFGIDTIRYAGFVDSDAYHTNDTITVFYLSSDPSINRDSSILY